MKNYIRTFSSYDEAIKGLKKNKKYLRGNATSKDINAIRNAFMYAGREAEGRKFIKFITSTRSDEKLIKKVNALSAKLKALTKKKKKSASADPHLTPFMRYLRENNLSEKKVLGSVEEFNKYLFSIGSKPIEETAKGETVVSPKIVNDPGN